MPCVVETDGRKALQLTPPSGVSYGLPRFLYGATALPLILEVLSPPRVQPCSSLHFSVLCVLPLMQLGRP